MLTKKSGHHQYRGVNTANSWLPSDGAGGRDAAPAVAAAGSLRNQPLSGPLSTGLPPARGPEEDPFVLAFLTSFIPSTAIY